MESQSSTASDHNQSETDNDSQSEESDVINTAIVNSVSIHHRIRKRKNTSKIGLYFDCTTDINGVRISGTCHICHERIQGTHNAYFWNHLQRKHQFNKKSKTNTEKTNLISDCSLRLMINLKLKQLKYSRYMDSLILY